MPDICLTYGKKEFVVEVARSKRKSLSITVHPDLRITARAPAGYEPEIIRQRLEKRVSWIAKQVDFFERFQPLPPAPKFVSGETHYYLGQQYRLKIRPGKRAQVRLTDRFFEMELPDISSEEKAKELMQGWYSAQARNLLAGRFAKYLPGFVKIGVSEPEVRYRRMKKRWGSYSSNGVIMLNTELVKAPVHCIDYVIIHELCHIFYPHHNKEFYHLLGQILPDWKKRKERLEKVII